MRLRLTVQRHGLPPVNVLWTVRPTNAPLSAGLTVSSFLEQVNDIIPLEADDWGLEDYTLEVEGFECLHFAELHQALKEDDKVSIRPLQTADLRVRRISGRHQISEGGIHLIDGVAFGRPYLRKTSRPAIRIPPRKRRRLGYDETEEKATGGQIEEQQLVLRDTLNASDGDSEEDEDEDFAPAGDDSDDLDDELRGLKDDLGGCVGDYTAQDTSARRARIADKMGGSKDGTLVDETQGLGLLSFIDEDGNFIAPPYNNPLLDEYSQDEPQHILFDLKVRKRRHGRRNQFSEAGMKSNSQDPSTPEATLRRVSASSNRSVHFEDDLEATPVTIRASKGSDDEDDGDFEPENIDDSDKENAPPSIRVKNTSQPDEEHADDSSTSSSEPPEPSDSDWTSSSGSSPALSSDSEPDIMLSRNSQAIAGASDSSSSSDSDSDAVLDVQTETAPQPQDADLSDSASTSSDSSTDSSDSDSDSEARYSPRKSGVSPDSSVDEMKSTETLKRTKNAGFSPQKIAQLPNTSSKKADIPKVANLQHPRPPGTGMNRTQTRNRRRSDRKRFSKLLAQGISSSDANLVHVGGATMLSQVVQKDQAKPGSIEFETKRQDLLKSLETGGVELGLGTSVASADVTGEAHSSISPTAENPASQANEDAQPRYSGASQVPPVMQVQDSLQSAAEATPEPQRRRTKLDLAGSKRLLFGSLGLKAPKTTEDAAKLREKLMKDARPTNQRTSGGQEDTLAAIEADQSWRNKITLRAVECCHDGVVLSEPPFPFVQRWDPQQQGNYRSQPWENYTTTRGMQSGHRRGLNQQGQDGVAVGKKKKNRKKRKRNNRSFYEDQNDDSYTTERQNKSPRREDFEPSSVDALHQDAEMTSQRPQGNETKIAVAEYQDQSTKLSRDVVGISKESGRENAGVESQDSNLRSDEPDFEDTKVKYAPDHEQEPADRHRACNDVDVADDQLLPETTESAELAKQPLEHEDLPELGTDLSDYRQLTIEHCQPGAVIAYKQLEMSSEGGWQPCVSVHRTAVIESMEQDELINLLLAKRDQPQPQKRRVNDDGERLYGKFEMPDFSDDEDRDLSKVRITFTELIEPLLVRAAEPQDEAKEQTEGRKKDDEDDEDEDEMRKKHHVENSKHSEDLSNQQLVSPDPERDEAHEEHPLSERRRKSDPQLFGESILVKKKDFSERRRHSDSFCETTTEALSIMADNEGRITTAGVTMSSPLVHAPDTQDRKVISKLIDDAGWNSSIGSEAKQRLYFHDSKARPRTKSSPSSCHKIPVSVGKVGKFLELVSPQRSLPERIFLKNVQTERRLFPTQSPSPLKNKSTGISQIAANEISPRKNTETRAEDHVSEHENVASSLGPPPVNPQTKWYGLAIRNVTFNRAHFLPALRAAGLDTQEQQLQKHHKKNWVTIWLQTENQRLSVRWALVEYPIAGLNEHPLCPELSWRTCGKMPNIPLRHINRDCLDADARKTIRLKLEHLIREENNRKTSRMDVQTSSDEVTGNISSDNTPPGTPAPHQWYGLRIKNITFDRELFRPALEAAGLAIYRNEFDLRGPRDELTLWLREDRIRAALAANLIMYSPDDTRKNLLYVEDTWYTEKPTHIPLRKTAKPNFELEKFQESFGNLVAAAKEPVANRYTDQSIEYPDLPHFDADSDFDFDQGQPRSFETGSEQLLLDTLSPPTIRRQEAPDSPSPMHRKHSNPVSRPMSEPTSRPSSMPSSRPVSRQSSQTKAKNSPLRLQEDNDSDELPELWTQKFDECMSQPQSQNSFLKPEWFSQPSTIGELSTKDQLTPPNTASISDGRPTSQRSSNESSLPNIKSEVNSSPQNLPPWQSIPPQQSQFVDLTISSDPFEIPDHGYDDGDDSYRPSSSLPTGSGWAKKASGKRISNSTKTNSTHGKKKRRGL